MNEALKKAWGDPPIACRECGEFSWEILHRNTTTVVVCWGCGAEGPQVARTCDDWDDEEAVRLWNIWNEREET